MAQAQQSKKNADENGFLAALSYISFLFIIPLFLKRNNKFVQSHAKQGLVLFIAEIGALFIMWIPLVNLIVWLALVAVAVIGISKSLKGEEWEIPYIGRYASKFDI